MSENISLLSHNGFDLDVAILLAEAANMAYKQPTIIQSWVAANGFYSKCSAFDHDNIQGFWCATDEVALISFRGTSNIRQWIRDARFLPIAHPWGAVHAGFNGGIENANPNLQAFMVFAVKAKHVWITGHSLGGALAVLAAAKLKMQGIVSSLYTFGQPRVGLAGFAENFEAQLPDRLYRFINQCDIVPRLPPGLIYRHSGLVKHIVPGGFEGTKMDIHEEELPPLNEEEFAALQTSLKKPEKESFEGNLPWISDHSMTEYIRLLSEIRG